jgi:hypothetical protein
MIDIALATKWRVDKLTRTIQAFVDNTDDLGTICVTYDSDDAETHAARDDILKKFPDKVSFGTCDPGSCTRAMNKSIERTKTKYIGLFADDAILKTKGWDTLSLSLFDKYEEYQCISISDTRTPSITQELRHIHYPFFAIFERQALMQLGGYDERYPRSGADKQLGVDMLLNDMLMMVSDEIVVKHIRDNDRCFKNNRAQGPIDNKLFNKLLKANKDMVIKKYKAVEDKWALLVKS